MSNIDELAEFYRSECISAYADAVAHFGRKPQQVLVEFENALGHVFQFYNPHLTETQREENILKARNHLTRLTLDCYKLIWVGINDELAPIYKDNERLFSCIDISPDDFISKYNEFKNIIDEARRLELSSVGVDPLISVEKYKSAIKLGRCLKESIDYNKMKKLESAKPSQAKGVQSLLRAKKIAVVYSDIVRSTKTLTQLGPKDFSSFLAMYSEMMANAIEDAGGVFDCFAGDGFIALFPCNKSSKSSLALDAVRQIHYEVERNLLSKASGILEQIDVKDLDCRYALTAGPLKVAKLGGRVTATGIAMIKGARLVGDKPLFSKKHHVVIAQSYVEADSAIGEVDEIHEKLSEKQEYEGATLVYNYPDFVSAQADKLYRPIWER